MILSNLQRKLNNKNLLIEYFSKFKHISNEIYDEVNDTYQYYTNDFKLNIQYKESECLIQLINLKDNKIINEYIFEYYFPIIYTAIINHLYELLAAGL